MTPETIHIKSTEKPVRAHPIKVHPLTDAGKVFGANIYIDAKESEHRFGMPRIGVSSSCYGGGVELTGYTEDFAMLRDSLCAWLGTPTPEAIELAKGRVRGD